MRFNHLDEAIRLSPYTTKEVAAICGINIRTMIRYKKGTSVPNVYDAIAIANVLGRDVYSIWGKPYLG